MIYTVEQVAKILQMHPETIRRNLKAGTIKGFKINQQWRISEDEIERMKKGV